MSKIKEHVMDRGTILQALSAVEQYIVQLRQQESDEKRRANELLSDAESTKRAMADEVSRVSRNQTDSQTERMMVQQVESRFQNEADQKKQAATDLEKDAQNVQSKIKNAESVLNELKSAEGYLRDYETRAKRWVDEAYTLMRS